MFASQESQEGGMKQLTLKDKMARAIARRKGEVLLRADFEKLGSPAQISRGLKALTEDGVIVRLGYGVYAKARPSTLSGRPVPRVTLDELAQEALTRMGVKVELGRAAKEYMEGKTTQIPAWTTFNTGGRRITRKIGIGINKVRYENDYRSRA